jgi:hypothetical protein
MFGRECDNSRGLENSLIVAKNYHCIGALVGGRRKGNIQLLSRGRLDYRESQRRGVPTMIGNGGPVPQFNEMNGLDIMPMWGDFRSAFTVNIYGRS